MPVTDHTLLLTLAVTANILLMYWKGGYIRRLLGGLFFIFIGMSTYFITGVTIAESPWGLIIAALGVIDLVFTILKT